MKTYWNLYGGYIVGALVWLQDHWSGLAALILFVMQAVYMFYKIKKAKKEAD